MKTSTNRILTTHVGSLPRPQAMFDLIAAKEAGKGGDPEAFERVARQSVEAIVRQQKESGIDVVSDGEMTKLSYAFYIKGRVAGVGNSPEALEKSRQVMIGRDQLDHPDFTGMRGPNSPLDLFNYPACIGPLRYADRAPLEQDLAHFEAAVAAVKPVDAFMTCASPGVLTKFVVDTHYRNEDAYVEALSAVMKVEYEAVVAAGFVLQIDCPDLASAWNNQYRDKTEGEFLRIAQRNVAALNAATAGIPPEAMRMHICWGNYEGPHTHDIPLTTIAPVIFAARPSAISFEGANPRHAHEWEELKDIRIPEDKVLIPGVIDSTTSFVEHPRLVAQRLGHYVDLVGRERVLAGADCGFSTVAAANPKIAPSIVWAKFKALREGADMASAPSRR
jgi:5-methyltetrahydropteroyltriglutamate--homocysteine methyltransferase